MLLICLRTCASLISFKKTAHNAEMVSSKGDDYIDFANTHIILSIPFFLMPNGTLSYGHTQNTVHVYSMCSPSGSAVRNHCRTHPAPCVRPRCVCSVLRVHAQFCRFDKADATADVQ